MLTRARIACFLAALLAALPPAFADGETPRKGRPFSGPLLLRNDHPLYLTLFSSALSDRAQTTDHRRFGWQATYMASNSIAEQHNTTESDRIIIDGEMQRFELAAKYGLFPGIELGASLPYLAFGGGYLDGFIESFEDTFGFTTPGARESRSSDQMRYLVRINGQNIVDETDETIQGLGDLALHLKYRLRDTADPLLPRVAARGLLKLPTATDPLLGNDRVDVGAGILAEQPLGSRILVYGNVDVTTAHLPPKLKTLDTDPVMASGSLGFEHFLTDKASWSAGFMISSNPYPEFSSDLQTFNEIPIGAGIGWTYRFSKRASLHLTAEENATSSWSDFAWSASFRADL